MSNARNIRALSLFSSRGAREAQEDFVLGVQEKGILAAADGFGGAGPGMEAAKTACESVRRFLEKEAGDLEATLPFVLKSYYSLAGNVLFNALIHANQKLIKLNKSRHVHERGGASMVAAYLDGDLLALANVGVCSAWLFREGRVVELVMPRTYARLIDPSGGATVSGPAASDERLQIPLTALGIGEDLEPEIFEYRIRPGDWVLLGTDGIHEEVRSALLELHGRYLLPADAVEEANRVLKDAVFSDNAAVSLAVF